MAVRFDAISENYTSTSSPPVGSAYTVSCWAMVSTDRNTWSAVWSSDSSTSNYSYLATDSDGVTMTAWTQVGGNERTVVGPVMTVGTWYRLCLVVNGANAILYHGTAAGALSAPSVANWVTLSTTTTLRIGVDPFSDEWLNGRVANFKHWSGALTQAEVERELSQYVPERTSDLVRWHPFIVNETVDYGGAARTLSGGTGSAREDGPPIPWFAASPLVVLPSASGTAYDKTITDPVGTVDDVTDVNTIDRVQIDGVGITDAATDGNAITRMQTDAVGIVDSITSIKSLTSTVTDPVGLLDAASQVLSAARNITDSIGVVDAATTTRTVETATTDVIGITDSQAQAAVVTRATTDAVGITDSVADASLEELIDLVGIVDSITDVNTLARVITDPVGLLDSVTDTWTITRTITDSIGLVDDVTGDLGGVSRTVTDPIGIVDSSATTRASTRVVSDPVGLVDSATSTTTSTRATTDAVGIVDGVQSTIGLSATRTDSIGITDSTTKTIIKFAVITDALGVTDNITHVATHGIVVTDLVGITDGASGAITGPQTGLRTRVSGREPGSSAGAGREPSPLTLGNEPINRISGSEVATP